MIIFLRLLLHNFSRKYDLKFYSKYLLIFFYGSRCVIYFSYSLIEGDKKTSFYGFYASSIISRC